MVVIQENKISEEIIKVRYSDIDFDKKLKLFSLLNFFQDIASDNAERLGFGYSYIYPQNFMWVLLKYRIEFEDYPSNIQELKLRTEPRGYNKLFAYRNFELLSNEKIIARASSMWSLVDFKNKSLIKIENIINNNPYMTQLIPNDTDLKYEKVSALTKVDYQKEFEVRYNDIDVNMHANNGNYIIWAMEPLDYNYKNTHNIKIIDMVFKKEAKYGEKLVSNVQFLDENTTIHELKNVETKEDLCLLKCEWAI